MKGKLAATLFALVFAIPFGGVGVGAAWMIGSMFLTANRADDWVLVQATVAKATLDSGRSRNSDTYLATGAYSYTFEGKSYAGSRLGVSPIEGSDNVGDWQESMAAYLDNARTTGKTIPVYVNPDNPAEAVVDREVRWPMVFFLGAFAVVFGGVGLGALIAIVVIWRKDGIEGQPIRKGARPGGSGPSDAWKGVIFLWVFAFFWNAISFPIAFLALPEIIENEEWVGLFVLLFPLVGLGVLWGAISSSLGLLKRGNPALALQPEKPRAGSTVNGWITFPRGVRQGEAFSVRLVPYRTEKRGDSTRTTSDSQYETKATAAPSAGGMRVAFRFDIPLDAPVGEGRVGSRKVTFNWRIEVAPAGKVAALYGFDIEMLPASESGFAAPSASAPGRAFVASATSAPTVDPAAVSPTLSDQAIVQLFGPEYAAKMGGSERAAFSRMTPEQQAVAGKFVRNAPMVKKVVVGFVFVFIAFQVLQFILALVGAFS